MKIQVHRKDFYEALKKAERVVVKNTQNPLLGCVLIKTGDGGVFLYTTNTEISVEVFVAAKVTEEGSVVVFVQPLSGYLGGVSDELVLFESVDGSLKISSKSGQTTIKGLPSDEFPPFPKTPDGVVVEAPADVLRQGIDAVSYSAAATSMKPELNAIFLLVREKEIVFAATDSFRLAEKKIPIKNKKESVAVLVPIRCAVDMSRILSDKKDEPASIILGENQLAVRVKNIFLITRLVNGSFPDYHQIIPKNPTTTVTILKNDLTQTLGVSQFFLDSFHELRIKVNPKTRKCELTAKSDSAGEVVERPSAIIEGEGIELSFNHRYLVESLPHVGSDSTSLLFHGPSRPVVIRGVGDPSFLYLVMPMNR